MAQERLDDESRKKVIRFANGLEGMSPSGNRKWTPTEISRDSGITFPSGKKPGRTTIYQIMKTKGVSKQKDDVLAIRKSEAELLTMNVGQLLDELSVRDLSKVKTKDITKMIQQLMTARDQRERNLIEKGTAADTASALERLSRDRASSLVIDVKEKDDGSFGTSEEVEDSD